MQGGFNTALAAAMPAAVRMGRLQGRLAALLELAALPDRDAIAALADRLAALSAARALPLDLAALEAAAELWVAAVN